MNYRVAVIGAGGIAGPHLAALHQLERTTPVAIADIQEDRARERAQAYEGVNSYKDYREMLQVEKPDIAIVTLPHFLHKEAALACAEAGAHLLLEKPMALDVKECDEILEAVNRSGIRVLVGHTQRYIAENLEAKRRIDLGELGRLVMINDARHVDYFHDKRPGWFFERRLAGGGILANLGSHSIDKAVWLSGSRVIRVKAIVSPHGGKGDIEGGGAVFLHHENGTATTIVQSGFKGAARNETELLFTGGKLRLRTSTSLDISTGSDYEPIEVQKEQLPFILQLLDLISHIETGSETACTLEDSRHIVAVIEALYRSHASGREEEV
ncbi:Predicted dehydrogenase [Paenibacillus sp. UNCCL117]|uniref:Gfo/Idh/MocA family protein n=1 Tax=unclassified Paenibacillus TaxID=185978 RepID=UPI0008895C09|nr:MULTISPECIES: Gfo/Idh/MocA family oxidoreductase [unclassified Paenibacillus]SDD40738.1 Predicted dehydrogenase [Paenibacillus sp. cl123]SFW48018.1 Predicted dehydrogenase [Paenibacillus sp. UNCCL117]